jgi:MFS family permease
MLSRLLGPIARLGVALFFAQTAFNLYGAALPLYLSSLGLDATPIGLLVGVAGIAELVGALAVGPAIDRFGGRALLLVGAACYLIASLGYMLLTAPPALAVLRLVQGFGLAAVIPSAYSFVPHLVRLRGQTLAFASLGAAGSAAMAISPPLGLTLLEQQPLALFVTAAGMAALAGLVVLRVPAPTPGRRPFGLTFRRAWLMPLLVAVLSVIQWGVIQAFIPIAARDAGSNPAILFTVDAICVLAARIPAGWIADRYGPLRLAWLGVIGMTFSPCTLLLPLNDGVLLAAGVLNGLGAGLTLPPMLAQISQRSDEATRGSGLAYFSVAFAVGMIVGASGGGLLFPVVGLHGLLGIGAALCAGGLLVLVADSVALRPARRQASGLPTSS